MLPGISINSQTKLKLRTTYHFISCHIVRIKAHFLKDQINSMSELQQHKVIYVVFYINAANVTVNRSPLK